MSWHHPDVHDDSKYVELVISAEWYGYQKGFTQDQRTNIAFKLSTFVYDKVRHIIPDGEFSISPKDVQEQDVVAMYNPHASRTMQ